jgi:hypothetical protein
MASEKDKQMGLLGIGTNLPGCVGDDRNNSQAHNGSDDLKHG